MVLHFQCLLRYHNIILSFYTCTSLFFIFSIDESLIPQTQVRKGILGESNSFDVIVKTSTLANTEVHVSIILSNIYYLSSEVYAG